MIWQHRSLIKLSIAQRFSARSHQYGDVSPVVSLTTPISKTLTQVSAVFPKLIRSEIDYRLIERAREKPILRNET